MATTALRLIQIKSPSGERQVVAAGNDGAHVINGVTTTYELAQKAIADKASIAATVEKLGTGAEADIALALAEGRVLAPIDHPDAAHLHVTGTGLTHLGSAEGRDKMHKAAQSAETQTDSMRMFLMGV